MSSPLSANTLLSEAASALNKIGSQDPVNVQIDTVANVLTGTRRNRELTPTKEGLPTEVKNVLEMLKIQIKKALENLAKREGSELLYHKFIADLEVIQAFADRIVQYYQSKEDAASSSDEELTSSLRTSLLKAKTEAISTLALEKMYQTIDKTESSYRSNPQMVPSEYRERLEDLTFNVNKWEKETLADEPMLKDSQTIAEKVQKLKNRLNQATQTSNLEAHPVVIGQKGLDILRKASEMIQNAKNQEDVTQVTEMADDANKNLIQGGEIFQERGRTFNLQIMQTIVAFVNKQLKKLEAELSKPSIDLDREEIADQLVHQMERLVAYFQFVKKWGGPHQEDLQERIALVYEKIESRAAKGKKLVLDEAAVNGISEEQAAILARIAAKYQKAETFGQDIIKPDEIFHGKK